MNDKASQLQRKHELILNSAGEGIYGLDIDGRATFVNPAAVKMTGWRTDETIGHLIHEVHHHTKVDGSPYPKEQCPIYAALKDGAVHCVEDEVFWRKDGSCFPVRYTSTPIREYGQVVGAVVVFEDITEKKRTETAFAQLQRRNELILSAAGEGIYGLDCEGITTFVNPAATKMLGWASEELIGQPMHSLLHHTWPDGSSYPREECPIYEAFKDGAVHQVDDEIFWRKDGSSFSVEYTSTPIHESGLLVGAVVVFRDITERKRTDKNLRLALTEVKRLKEQFEAENVYLQEEIKVNHNFEEILGRSAPLRKILHQVEQVASTDATVLILGETGTGKELFARSIHDLSDRKERPLVKVNCAALPTTLIESELFGHEKGSFTGAIARKIGRFELANGGTIFLDEIGELPLDLQPKLLRVLQEGDFERLGSTQTINVDVRIIAATNRDLKKMVKDSDFRDDLYFRLSVFPLTLPPLRARKKDIPMLVQWFVSRFTKKLGKQIQSVPQNVMNLLQNYAWPGNIRELENVIERAVILTRGSTLSVQELDDSTHNILTPQPDQVTLEEIERAYIGKILETTNWLISGDRGAAAILGLHPNTLRSRMQKLGIKRSSSLL